MVIRYLFAALVLTSALFAQKDLGRVIPGKPVLRVVAVGDFGSGNVHQVAVARAMVRRNQETPFDLGISLGDNFYRCGVRSAGDPLWKSRWEDLYTPIGVPFFASLGNHDYGHPPIICPEQRASPEAEIAYSEHSQSWRMPSRYYTFVAGDVRFFAIDTEGWSDAQLQWLKSALDKAREEPGIRWRIVYGHHPMYTSGVHLNQRRIAVLRSELTPIFKEAHVDLYVAGHDHDMEHLRTGGIEYLICGAGGAQLRAVRHAQPESLFHATTFGFLDINIDEHQLSAAFLDTKLKPLETPEMTITK